MARPPQEAIDTFVSITGADETVVVLKLEEHGGDLNQAINSHFNERDSTLNGINQNPIPASRDDMMDLDGPLDNTFQRSFPETFRDPFALMDPNVQQQFFDGLGSTDSFSREPLVSHPREAREIPIEVKDNDPQTGPSDQAPVFENVTGHEPSRGPEVRETIIIDDEDYALSSAASALHANIPSNTSRPNPYVNDYDNDIEEEMIRAAMEASKKHAERLENTVEQERDQHVDGAKLGDCSDEADMGTADGTVGRQGLASGKAGTPRQPIDEESFQEEAEDVEEQPLVRRRSRRFPSENTELAQPVHPSASPAINFQPQSNLNGHQYNGDDFPSEWGGISSEEHDEAVMLEAAMFGGVPEGPTYPFSMPSHRSSTCYPPIVHSPPPELTEQRLLREQQV
uniref:Plant UBX domain-containing protein 8 n=1 Tax=Arundo donax TaxID=35708 RepID=A0A0A9DYX4_ARUDO